MESFWSRLPLSGCPQERKKPHTTATFLLSIGDSSLGKMNRRPKYKDKTTEVLRESTEGNISNLWLGKHRYNTKSISYKRKKIDKLSFINFFCLIALQKTA